MYFWEELKTILSSNNGCSELNSQQLKIDKFLSVYGVKPSYYTLHKIMLVGGPGTSGTFNNIVLVLVANDTKHSTTGIW